VQLEPPKARGDGTGQRAQEPRQAAGQPNLLPQIPRHTFANILRRGRTPNWEPGNYALDRTIREIQFTVVWVC
jgi:hypothetical protein